MGEDGCIIIPLFTSRTFGNMRRNAYFCLPVHKGHSKHDRFIASSGAKPSQTPPPPFTELRTHRIALRHARRRISDFVTRHTGSGGNLPLLFKHRVRNIANPPGFIAHFYADCPGTRRAKFITIRRLPLPAGTLGSRRTRKMRCI